VSEPLGPLIAILLCFLLPGLTWGPLLAPGRLSDLGRLGRAVGASIIVTGLLATALAVSGRLDSATGGLTLVIATILPLASSSVRRELLDWVRVRRRIGPAAITIAAVAVTALHLARSHAVLGPESLPATSTVWYYAHLADLVGSTGGLPALFPEWGGLRPFQTDYLPFTAHSALVFSLMGVDLVASLEIYRLAILAAVMAVATMLFRRWMPTWVALVGAVLLVTTLRMDWKLLSYKPETFGFVIGLYALWLADRAAVERSMRLTLSAAIAFGFVVMSHAEIAVVMLPAVAAIAVARGVLRPGGGRSGLRLRLGHGPLRSTLIPLVAVAVGVSGGLAANSILTGQGGLLAYVTGGETSKGPATVAIDEALLPEGWVLSADPTWNFNIAAVAGGQAGTAPPRSFTDRRLLSRENFHVWAALDARTWPGLVALAAILLVPLLAWPWLDSRRRSLVVILAIFAVGLLAGAWLLNAISDTYVPRRIGARRLLPYELLVPVGAAMVGVLLLARGLGRVLNSLRVPPGRRALIAGIGIATVIFLPLVSSTRAADEEESTGITARGYAAYEWLRANLIPDARILANAYTDGSLTLLSGRTGILDGRAVYLEDPPFLSEATGLLLGGRRFFGDPSNPGSDDYLAMADVDYLLVATTPDSGFDLGGYRPFVTDLEALDSDPRFSFVQELAGGSLRLYQVLNVSGAR
jgi:hypothetical protein